MSRETKGDVVRVVHRPPALCTAGLLAQGHPELEVIAATEALSGLAAGLLRHLAAYVVEHGARLAVGQTIQHGSWLVQVQEGADGRRRLGAMVDDSGTFAETIDQALIIEDAQRRQCALVDAEFHPPLPQHLVVVDQGAMAGEPVAGVRYPGPPHMSGWWITADATTAGTEHLQTLHVPHLITQRPDLLHLLALPCGWRFDTVDGFSAWFDEAVARDDD